MRKKLTLAIGLMLVGAVLLGCESTGPTNDTYKKEDFAKKPPPANWANSAPGAPAGPPSGTPGAPAGGAAGGPASGPAAGGAGTKTGN